MHRLIAQEAAAGDREQGSAVVIDGAASALVAGAQRFVVDENGINHTERAGGADIGDAAALAIVGEVAAECARRHGRMAIPVIKARAEQGLVAGDDAVGERGAAVVHVHARAVRVHAGRADGAPAFDRKAIQ